MPWGDGTGPFGETDWPCRRAYGAGAGGFGAGFAGMRRGFGRGRGRGFGGYGGYGRRFYSGAPLENGLAPAELTREERRKILEAELAEVEAEKNALEKTLKELDKEKKW